MKEKKELLNKKIAKENEKINKIENNVSDEILKLINGEKNIVELDPNIIDPFEKELEEKFEEKIIGQNKAKKALINAIINNLFSIRPKKGPLGVFFFTGPSGVGKTQIAKTLAEILLGSEDYITKIDCEKYSQDHTSVNLFGSPKSYVGYQDPSPLNDTELFKHYNLAKQSGTLHEKIKYYQNFAIILFDEIEKAHPKIHQSLLSAMADGKISFPTGREDNKNIKYSKITDLSNCIIIFTSNIGNRKTIEKKIGLIKENNEEEKKKEFKKEFEKYFSPEFIGRIDEFITFDYLKEEDIFKILKLQTKELKWYFGTLKGNIKLNIEDKVLHNIVKKSYSTKYGARPSITMFRNTIEADINKIINSGQLESIFENYENYKNTYEFILNVSLKNGKYHYSLERKHIDKANKKSSSIIKKTNNYNLTNNLYFMLNPIQSGIEQYLETNKIKYNTDKQVKIIKEDLFDILKYNIIYKKYFDSIKYMEATSKLKDNYKESKILSQEEKKAFKHIGWNVVKKIIERKLKLYKGNLDYNSEDFKNLFFNILYIIDSLNGNILSPTQAEAIIKIIDYIKKNKLK